MIKKALAYAAPLPLMLASSTVAVGQEAANSSTMLERIVIESNVFGVPSPREAGTLLPAAAGGQVATGSQLGILGNRDALTTPFNVTGYTAKLIADTEARSIADVTANDPSVRTTFPRSSYRDVYSIRGFNLSSYNLGFNGLYGIAPKQRYPAEFAERVEILKGPDTFLNGVSLGGSVGGTINIISKKATDAPVTSVATAYASDGDVGTHLDYGRRFGTNKEFGVRFNGLVRGGDLAIADQSERLGAGALSLDYQGDRFRLYGDFGLQQQKLDAPDWTVTVAPGVKAIPVPASTISLSQPWTWVRTGDVYGALRAEYDLSDNWTAFGALGASATETTGLYVQPTSLRANGDFTGEIASFPSNGTHYSGQLGIRGRFDTGPVEHNVTVAAARWDQNLKATRTILGKFSSNIFDPVSIPRPDTSSIIGLDDIHRTAEHDYTSLVFADTLALLDSRLLLTVGGRWQGIESSNFSASTGARTSSYDKSKFSPAAGAVFKLSDNVSLYGNYVEALQQGTSAPSDAVNHGEAFAPIVARQIEAGIKVDWGTWSTSLGVFQITQPTGISDPVTRIYSQDGEQQNRGIEFNLAGEPLDGIRVLGGFLLLDGQLTRSSGARYDGNSAIGAPDYQYNLGMEWDTPFASGLTLSARVIGTGKQFVDAANTQAIDSWTRFDIGARYRIERQDGGTVTLRLAVENVFDKGYWASATSERIAGISRGAPRTFLASTTFEF